MGREIWPIQKDEPGRTAQDRIAVQRKCPAGRKDRQATGAAPGARTDRHRPGQTHRGRN